MLHNHSAHGRSRKSRSSSRTRLLSGASRTRRLTLESLESRKLLTTAMSVVSPAELGGMQLLYAVNDNQFDFNDAYTVDNSASIAPGSFTRVAYFVELGNEWVWTSMDTFNADPKLVGVPKAGSNIVENGTLVSNLNVESNSPNITPGTGLNGIIEFWASNYNANGGGQYGSNDSQYDWKDSGGSTGGGHGSFQVFELDSPTHGRTLFGITANGGSGIGDQPTAQRADSPDWTFGPGTGTYTIRNLEIWVGNSNLPPVIANLDGDTLNYTPGVSGTQIIDQATAAAADDPIPIGANGWNGGDLTVSITAGGAAADDVVSVRNQGTAAGQIGFTGGTVSYGGTAIGTAVGGAGGSDLVVTFNTAATTAAISALLGNITYLNANGATLPTTRLVSFTLTDGDGLSSTPSNTFINMNVGGAVATYVWDGTGDGSSFNDANNWVGDTSVPDANDIAIFRDADPGVIDLAGTRFVGEIRFDGAGSYTLQGGALVVDTITQQATATGNNVIAAQITSTLLTGTVSAGQLSLTNVANSATLLGGTWTVGAGSTLVATTSNANTGLGKADVDLTGGTLEFAAGDVTTVNALMHAGFARDGGDANFNLHNNGGMLNAPAGDLTALSPQTRASFRGMAPTTGPLNFPNEAAILADGVMGGLTDNYCDVWYGYLTTTEIGNWQFQRTAQDDWTGMWIDIDQDGILESSAAGLGSNRGEQLAYNDGGVKTVNLTNPLGTGRYLVAFTHLEGGGGANAAFQFKSPSGGALAYINPSAQPGLWTIESIAPGSLANNVRVLANSTILIGATLPGVALNQLTMSAGTQLQVNASEARQDLSFATVVLNGDATINASGRPDITLKNISETAPANITYSGDSVVSLPTPNTYTGVTTIASGTTVDVSANAALGTIAGGTVVQPGGALSLTGGFVYSLAEPLTLNGAGNAFTDAALLNAGGNNDFYGPITLGASAKIRSAANNLRLFGQVETAGNNLELRADAQLEIWTGLSGGGTITKTGGNRVIMLVNADAGTTFSGQLNINEGIWDARGNNSLGTAAGDTLVANGARLELRDGRTLADNITINGNSGNSGAIRSENNSNTLTGTITLASGSSIHVNETQLTITGQIVGNQALTKTGTGTLLLNQDNSISNFDLAGGEVRIKTQGAFGGTTTISVDPSESLEFDGNLNFTTAGTLQSLTINDGTLRSIAGATTLDIPINVGLLSDVYFDGAGELTIPRSLGNGSAPVSLDNALLYFGFHINNDGLAMNLNNNGGMMGGSPIDPTRFNNYYGFSVLTSGPSDRGLRFLNDQEFIATGSVNQVDNYSDLFIGILHVSPADAGQWHFRIAQQDDPTGIWIDLNQDGVFQSNGNLNSDQNEQLAWNTTNDKVVNLGAGDYMIAFTHREGGGGSIIDARFRSPTITTETIVKPADPAQAGLWSGLPLTPDNNVLKNGTGKVTLSGDNTYNGVTSINAGTLVAAHNHALGLTSSGTSVGYGGTLALASSGPAVVITGEALTINGSGAAGQPGALVNLTGDNTYANDISLSGFNDVIGAAAGTLTVQGNILLHSSDLTFDGAGDVIVNGVLSGDLAPGQIPALGSVSGQLEIWLDATDINGNGTATANGALVSNWVDKSGKGRNFNDVLGDPNYVVSSTHGEPAVNFDGNDALRLNAAFNPRTFIDGNGEFTLITVARYSGNTRGRVIAARTGHNWLFGFHGGSTNRNGHYDGWGSNDPAPVGFSGDENWHLHENLMNVFGDANNPAGDWYRDGVLATNDSRGTGDSFNNNVPDGLSLGAWNGLNEASTAEVSELIMYNRVLSETERLAVEGYLANKYGFSIPIAAGVFPTNAVTKLGTGSVTLTGSNSYNGETTINAGTLIAANSNALGQTIAGTTVLAGGTLGLLGDITIPASESLTISGDGVGGLGALRNLGGNNTVAGNIATTIYGGTSLTIGADAGQLTIQGEIDLMISHLTVTGAGAVEIQGRIFTSQNVASIGTPGLLETIYQLPTANAGNGFLLTTATSVGTVVAGPTPYSSVRAGESNGGPWTVIGDNEAIVYTGQIFDADGVFSFGKMLDDAALILIDGAVVMQHTQWNAVATTGVLNLTPGWHDLEIRFVNGNGGAGPSGNQGGSVGWANTKGFGFNVNGSASLDGNDYVSPVADPGDATFLRHNVQYFNTNNSLTKNGSGSLILANGGNAYPGGTTVNSGSLFVTNPNGSATGPGDVNVQGGFVGGTGTISGAVTVNALGVLSAGAGYQNGALGDFGLPTSLNVPAGAPIAGTLTVGSLNLLPNSISTIDITTGGSDKLVVNGNVAIAPDAAIGTGEIRAGVTPPAVLVVVENVSGGTTTGSFFGLPNGQMFDFDGRPAVIYYNYDTATGALGGNDVAILFVQPLDAVDDPAGGLPNASYETDKNPTLFVSAANGVLANDIGGSLQITTYQRVTAQGASVALNPDGSFRYFPIDSAALRALPAGAQAVDTFTYTINNSGNIGAPITTGAASPGAFAVSSTDLLTGLTAAVTGTAIDGMEGTSGNPAVLTNSQFGTPDSIDGSQNVALRTGTILTYNLDLSASPSGYDIARINTFTGWQDNGRVNQNYTVQFATASEPNVFISLATVVAYTPNDNSGHVEIAAPSGAILARGVARVRFVMGAQQNGYVGYREIDIQGIPSPATDTATVSIAVNGVNDPPTAVDDNAGSVNESAGSTALANVLTNDSDPDGDALSVATVNGFPAGSAITLPSGAIVVLNANGVPQYNPNGAFDRLNAGQTAVDTFTYALTGAVPPPIGTPVVNPASSSGAFGVASADLLAGRIATVTGTALGGQEGTSSNPALLTDGLFGPAGTPAPNNGWVPFAVSIANNTTLTYALDLAASPDGYDLSAIETFSGWRDGGRDRQNYTVRYSTVSNPGVFIDLVNVAENPNPPPSGLVTILPSAGMLATGVAQVQFVFTNQENGFAGYRELDVHGRPTTPLDATVSVTIVGEASPPVLAPPTAAHVTVNEGSTATNSGTFSDPDSGDVVTITASVGQVTQTGTNSGTWNWSLLTTDGDAGPFTVTITATDLANISTTTTFTYSVLNVAPTLTISGPPTVLEGSPYVLTLNSSDPGADTISSWAINWGDGSGIETVAGNPASVSHVYDNGPNNYTISASATDEDGTYAANTLAITVNNAPPIPQQDDVLVNGQSLGGVTTDLTVVPGLEVTFVVSTTDPALDHLDAPFRFTVNFGDGSPTVVMTASEEGQPLSFTHVYTEVGQTYQPTLTVQDEFTTPPKPSSLATTINLAEVTVARQVVIDDVLYVGGSERSDRIIVSGDGSIRFNGTPLPKEWPGGRMVIFGNAGSDTITTSGVRFPVEFYGGTGNDYLAGGTSDDILDGGDDNDRILGGNGNDILLGGSGNDRLTGGAGDDYAFGDHMIDFINGEMFTFSFNGGAEMVELPIRLGSNPGRDIIAGDNGNDILYGGPANDTLTGGNGNDLLRGGEGSDRLDGGYGDDLLLGEGGADLLYGRNGADILIGGSGLDSLYGGNDDDLLYGGDLLEDTTDDDLQDLWMLWRTAQQEDAVTALESLFGEDDIAGDVLHGERGDDWYLLFANDRLRISSEAKAPNEIRRY